MKISRVEVDLAKEVYQLHGTDHNGKTLWKRQLSRSKWLPMLFEHIEPGAIIGMEACTGAHHWGRILRGAGYDVKIIPPNFVKPFVKSNKNDANDAQAICEAMMRPDMHPVAIKTVAQQDIQATHRVREEIKSHRTSKANHIRGFVAEYGLVAPRSLIALRKAIPLWLDDASNGLTIQFRKLLHGLWGDLRSLDERMKELDHQIAIIAQENSTAKRLQQVPGIGPLIATALVGAKGDGTQYRKGRDMAAAVGLTPRQHSSGGKQKLLGISKRGDSYLRTLMIHGGRAAMRYLENNDDHIVRWIVKLRERKHSNVVAVAMANKLTRIAWAIMSKDVEYEAKNIAA